MATSTAHARWMGSTIEGSGTVTTESPALMETPLTWKARTGDEPGTTPEELMASAHAGCYAMAFSFALTNEGHEPDALEIDCTYEFGPKDGGFEIKGARLTVRAEVPGIDEPTFMKLAEGAKDGCPVSAALTIPISLDAKLAQHA